MMSFLAARDFAYEAGRITGMVFVVVLVLAVVARVAQGGKAGERERAGARRALWMVLGAVLVVGGAVGYLAFRSESNERALSRLMQKLTPLAEESRRKVAAGELESMADPLSQMVAVFKDFSREEDGSDVGVFALCFGQSMETVIPAAQHYDETAMAFMKMGGWDASSVAAKKDASKRLTLLPGAIRANREFVVALKGLDGTIRQQLRAAGFDEFKVSSATEAFMGGANMTRAIRVHEMEDELLGLAQTQLKVLRDNPSSWRARGMRADFTGEISPEAQNTYVEAANRADQILQEAARLMMQKP